jgi:hypothetical protein
VYHCWLDDDTVIDTPKRDRYIPGIAVDALADSHRHIVSAIADKHELGACRKVAMQSHYALFRKQIVLYALFVERMSIVAASRPAASQCRRVRATVPVVAL